MSNPSEAGKQFEDFAVEVFTKLFSEHNVKIIQTTYHSDGGKDAIGESGINIGNYNDNQKYWIEAKLRTNKNLKLEDISKTLILVYNEGVHHLYIVTNGYFAPQTIRESRNFSYKSSKNIFLVDGSELKKLAEKANVKMPINFNIKEKKNSSVNSIEVITSLFPNSLKNYSSNLKLSSKDIAYIIVNINIDRSQLKCVNSYIRCKVGGSEINIFPKEFSIPKNAVGTFSKQFFILCNNNDFVKKNYDLEVAITTDDKVIESITVSNAFVINNPILPQLNVDSFTKPYVSIIKEINDWENDAFVKNIFIKAEAGVGKSFLIKEIRHEILKRGHHEILLDGESHKYPTEVLQRILGFFFPIQEESFSYKDLDDVKYILSNSDIEIDHQIINYISEVLCSHNHLLYEKGLTIEFLADVTSQLLLRLSPSDKKQIFIYEDLHKTDISVLFYLEELQRLIRKKSKANRILFILTSRESRNTQDVETTALWVQRLEALYKDDSIKTIILKAIDKEEAANILNELIPSLNKYLCKKIVQQGGSTPFFLKEYLGLMLQDGLIKFNENTGNNYSVVNPLGLKSYVDENKFIKPTKERLGTIFNRYSNSKIKDFISLAASFGQEFDAVKLLHILDNQYIEEALSKCFELEIIKRSELKSNIYLFDHDIIRYTVLEYLNPFEHAKYANMILNNLEVNTSQRIKFLYQSGQGELCFHELKRELTEIEKNPTLYYTALQWKQLAINLIDHSFFKGIISEYKDLLLSDWDYVFYTAPKCSIDIDLKDKNHLLKEFLFSALETLSEISSGSDNLTNEIISEGLMLTKQSSDKFGEATFRYYHGYLLMERNDVAKSLNEHQMVYKLIDECIKTEDASELLKKNQLRLAICYRKIGEFDKSRRLLLEGLRLNKDKTRNYYVGFRGNFAATYFYTDPKRHQKYYLRTLEIVEKQKAVHLIARTNLQLAISFFRLDDYKQAEYRFLLAKKSFKSLQSTNENIRYNLNWSSYLFVVKQDIFQAEILLKEAEELALRQRNERRLWRIYANLATIYECLGEITKAVTYDTLVLEIILKGLDFSNSIISKVILFNRERCALINISIRAKIYSQYRMLNIEMEKHTNTETYYLLKKDAEFVLSKKSIKLSMEMGSFFKQLPNKMERAILME
ncbi:MAG: restriction endonuclease [Bacteroidales bacterium]|nr:restriction endonuclease [Bacteroidales bacterium]